MSEDAAVLDAGTDIDFGSDVDTSAEPTVAAPADGQGEAKPHADEFKDDKSYREALKSWRDANKDNPEVLKHVKRAYNLNGQFAELSKLDPKGLTGVRETYALLQSAGGPEKIVELQQAAQEYQTANERIAAGDPKALEQFGPEFDKGLGKIAPAYLGRIAKGDPQAYADAILPHLMSNLRGSPLVQLFNAMIDDVQAEGVDEKGKIQRIMERLKSLSEWFGKQEARVGQLKQGQAAPPQDNEFQQRVTAQEQREKDFFWKTQVTPGVVSHENAAIEKALAPFQAKLKLPDAAKKDLILAIKSGLTAAGNSDKTYIDTMNLFRNQKTPDLGKVTAHVRAGIDKHVVAVVKAVTEARYGHVIAARPGPKTGTGESRTASPVVAGAKGTKAVPITVPTKPARETVDWQATKRHGDIYSHVYVLTNGKTVRWNRK